MKKYQCFKDKERRGYFNAYHLMVKVLFSS